MRERTGKLVRDAEAGKLSIVSKHDLGVFVATPFDEDMLRCGVRVVLVPGKFRWHATVPTSWRKRWRRLPMIVIADAGPLMAITWLGG